MRLERGRAAVTAGEGAAAVRAPVHRTLLAVPTDAAVVEALHNKENNGLQLFSRQQHFICILQKKI